MPKDAFLIIRAELVSCNTDPAQYKRYNPHLNIANENQRVFVELKVPTEFVLSNKTVGKGAKKKHEVVITAEGMAVMLKFLATDMEVAQAKF